jgi:transcription-repair coupling factor (superfamily II helicase)
MHWFDRVANHLLLERLGADLAHLKTVTVRGSAGSSSVVLGAALSRRSSRPIVMVVAHLDDADEALEVLRGLEVDALRFPALEIIPAETQVNVELVAERLTLLRRVVEERPPAVIVAPVAALMQPVPDPASLPRLHRVIRPGDRVSLEELLSWLTDAGYTRVPAIDAPGEFAVRGGILDLFPPGSAPARLDLFGDAVEGAWEIDLGTMGSDRRLEAVEVVATALAGSSGFHLDGMLAPQTLVLLCDVGELMEQGRSYLERAADAGDLHPVREVLAALAGRHSILAVGDALSAAAAAASHEIPAGRLPDFAEGAPAAVGELAELARRASVVVLCQNQGESQRMRELLAEHAPGAAVEVETRYLHRGFVWDEAGPAATALVPYHELLHRYQTRRRIARIAGGRFSEAHLDLQPGDFVVHRDHGIARYAGLAPLEPGAQEEYLTLEFSGSTRLHVPATRIDLVQRYIGAFRGTPELSTLGGRRWRTQKERVRDAVEDLAGQMLSLQAQRESLPGIAFPADTAWQREFEAEFPYEETEDQISAIDAVKGDMSRPRPMDRLVCGDVGFGKTEVAIRAAFKAAEYGRQVAVLVPTTWLAEQHERTFRERLADYPFRIESISRFKTAAAQREILEDLRKGQVDLIIGTHRLISADVRFADLGLVIIDEEQRFGVEHKQRLLALRATADVLTLTATPIPRTLHMAMLGLRDISSLATPPLDRRAVVTEVMAFDERRVRRAIDRELAREGQVYFVHNRIHDIHEVADRVQALAPGARVVVGHGQMATRELEQVMRAFVRREADILVSTTIIESGVDIPTANTMFIDDAQIFGLAELHQLRGRVGRYKHRAYCYLLLDPRKPITPEAMKRLRAIESFSMLGAGFKIALRDLEIRGAGNLLGAEQSGHIAAVGYEMYCQLLEQCVRRLKEEPDPAEAIEVAVELGVSGTIPKGYIPSDARRMDAYRRIARAATPQELEAVERDLTSAYGEPPQATRRVLELAAIRVAAGALGIRSILRRDPDIVFRTVRPAELERTLGRAKGSLRLVGQPDAEGASEVYYRPPPAYLEPQTLLPVLRARLRGEPEVPPAPPRPRVARAR